ncbi:MAG: DUF4292 domain-containing protein, partial [Ferruginibacter sp.]
MRQNVAAGASAIPGFNNYNSLLRNLMKHLFFITAIILGTIFIGCKTAKQINKAISPKDTTNLMNNRSSVDSLKVINETVAAFKSHYIDFKTFSAKIKVDTKGKSPDITAVVRILKDSAIWISLSATILNVEIYRALITRDSVILLNKRDKEVQYRSLDYLQEVTEVPFDFSTLQDLLVGNPVFYNDTISSYKQYDRFILISSFGQDFKNLMTLSLDNKLLLH